MESELGIDDEHVIVDKKDWFILQRCLHMNPSLIKDVLDLEEYFTNEEYKKKQELYQNHKPGL